MIYSNSILLHLWRIDRSSGTYWHIKLGKNIPIKHNMIDWLIAVLGKLALVFSPILLSLEKTLIIYNQKIIRFLF